jgi:hypothetical protein
VLAGDEHAPEPVGKHVHVRYCDLIDLQEFP